MITSRVPTTSPPDASWRGRLSLDRLTILAARIRSYLTVMSAAQDLIAAGFAVSALRFSVP